MHPDNDVIAPRAGCEKGLIHFMSLSYTRLITEALGSAMLVGAGMLALASGVITGSAGLDGLAIALVVGLTLMAMLVIASTRGGGHFNPAFSLAALVTGRCTGQDAAGRIIAQLVGAALAGGILLGVFGTDAMAASVPEIGSGVGLGAAMLLEGIATFALVMLWLRTRDQIGALLVGLGMTLGVMLLIGITGGMLNPIRAFGPELSVGEWTNAMVWWIGPLAGGLAAALAERFLVGGEKEELAPE